MSRRLDLIGKSTEEIQRHSEKLNVEFSHLNSKTNSLISNNFDKFANTNELMTRLKSKTEEMDSSIKMAKEAFDRFVKIMSSDKSAKLLDDKNREYILTKKLNFAKKIPSVMQNDFDKKQFCDLIKKYEIFKKFKTDNENNKNYKNDFKAIEFEVENIYLKFLAKFNHQITTFEESPDYYLEIFLQLKNSNFTNENNFNLPIKILTAKSRSIQKEIELIFDENKMSEKSLLWKNFLSSFSKFIEKFRFCFLSFDKNEKMLLSFVSFGRDIFDFFLNKWTVFLMSENVQNEIKNFKEISSKMDKILPEIDFSKRIKAFLANKADEKMKEFLENCVIEFKENLSKFDDLVQNQFYSFNNITKKIDKMNEKSTKMLKVFQIANFYQIGTKTLLSLISENLFLALFKISKILCFGYNIYQENLDMTKQIRKLDNSQILEKSNSLNSLIRSILIKSFKKLLVPQIALNFKKSLKDEKKSVFDFMSEKRLNFVFDSSADFLVAVFVKSESLKLEKILNLKFDKQNESLAKTENDNFEIVLVDNAVDLKSDLIKFHGELEALLEIVYNVPVSKYEPFERPNFYKKNDNLAILNSKTDKNFNVQSNLPSSVFNIWKLTLMTLITSTREKMAERMFKQIQINLAIIFENFPKYLLKTDVLELGRFLVEFLEICHRKTDGENSYLGKDEIDVVFKKYNCYV